MIIHYYKQFFTGPDGVGTMQPRELVRTLAQRGHEVHVISTNYNVYDERNEPPEKEGSPGGGWFHVHRLPSPRGLRRSLRTRLQTYASFAALAGVTGLHLPPPDIVVGSVQPLFSGVAALGVARARRAPFVLEVRDLWPDALEVKGAVTGWKLRPLYAMANVLYRRAARIVSLTPGIKKELVKKGLDADHIDVFPNGFDPQLFNVAPDARALVRARFGWGDDIVFLYTGAHTEVTAVDVIVRAAAALGDRDGVRFELFGQGQTKPGAERLARDLGVRNLRFHDPVPKSEIPGLLAAADVGLMTLFVSPLVHIYFENKLIDYMGSGKPILAALGGVQAELIEKWETGRVVPAFDHEGLARRVSDVLTDFESFARLGDNGRALVQEHFLLRDILGRYADVVEAAAYGGLENIPAWEPAA